MWKKTEGKRGNSYGRAQFQLLQNTPYRLIICQSQPHSALKPAHLPSGGTACTSPRTKPVSFRCTAPWRAGPQDVLTQRPDSGAAGATAASSSHLPLAGHRLHTSCCTPPASCVALPFVRKCARAPVSAAFCFLWVPLALMKQVGHLPCPRE